MTGAKDLMQLRECGERKSSARRERCAKINRLGRDQVSTRRKNVNREAGRGSARGGERHREQRTFYLFNNRAHYATVTRAFRVPVSQPASNSERRVHGRKKLRAHLQRFEKDRIGVNSSRSSKDKVALDTLIAS
jgi:hypothetical protein